MTGMTQPHYIDRAADIAARLDVLWLELNDAHSAPPATARILNAMHDASHLLKILSAPMEAVAWRWRWPDTNKWHYADYNLHPEAEEVQALALIATHPVQGGGT